MVSFGAVTSDAVRYVRGWCQRHFRLQLWPPWSMSAFGRRRASPTVSRWMVPL